MISKVFGSSIALLLIAMLQRLLQQQSKQTVQYLVARLYLGVLGRALGHTALGNLVSRCSEVTSY